MGTAKSIKEMEYWHENRLYNVIFQIQEIRRHPSFQINQGVLRTNFLQDDLSVIFVKVNILEDLSSDSDLNLLRWMRRMKQR